MKRYLITFEFVQEKLSALERQQKIFVFLATLLILGGGFYYFQYSDQAQRIRRLKTNISEQEKKLFNLKQAAVKVEGVKKELAEAEEEFARILLLFPSQWEIPGLLENVSTLGAQMGLENILFQPQPEQAQEFYTTIPIRLDLVGRYHELGAFFDCVSKLNRVLKVENLSMTRQKERDASRLHVGCTIVTYRFLENAPAQGEPGKKK
jgi:type IV pilus assembly protein PilO